MTIEDQDKLVGRVHREREAARAQRDALFTQVSQLGALLGGLAKALASLSQPDGHRQAIRIDAHGVTIADPSTHGSTVAGAWPTLDELRQLLSELHSVEDTLVTLEEQATRLRLR